MKRCDVWRNFVSHFESRSVFFGLHLLLEFVENKKGAAQVSNEE